MTLSNYFSKFVNICVDFLCLDFGVQMVQETPRSLSQQWLSINFSSFQRLWDVAAPLLPRERPPTKIAMALQRAARARRLYKLPLAAAVATNLPERSRGEGAETARTWQRLKGQRQSAFSILLKIHTKILPDILLGMRSYTYSMYMHVFYSEIHSYTCIY